MNGSYVEQHEMDKFDKMLVDHISKDTIDCWIATRINGASASMACGGNVSIPLLKIFDAMCKNYE